MDGNSLMKKVVDTYRANFDVKEPYEYHGVLYDACAEFNLTSAKYVLVKKAELWRANCFEYVFFLYRPKISLEDVNRFHSQLLEYMEPELVRQGEKVPQKNHMYTYLTGIFLSDEPTDPEVIKAVGKLHFRKNYRFAVRGFSEERIVLFHVQNRKVTGNPAAKELIKGYKKMLKF
ncbi:MAG: hypothetical protein ACI4EO_06410 [Blautia sp.]